MKDLEGVKFIGIDGPGLAKTSAHVVSVPGATEALAEAVAQRVVAMLKEKPLLDEPKPELLTVKEAAALIGITPNAVQLRIMRQQIPGVVRIGGSIRVNRARLLEFLSGRRR